MDRYWFLTWTTYGTWLPGDERGFVSTVREDEGPRVRHNIMGTPYDENIPQLKQAAQNQLRGDPVNLNASQASLLLKQFQDTANHRGWLLLAAAIMRNHVHLIVGVPGDPDPASLLRDFKSYGSRALNAGIGKPPSGTWWTESGSRRKLIDEEAARAKVSYVRHQEYPLLIWVNEEAVESLASGGR